MFPSDPPQNIRKLNISYPLIRTRTGNQKRTLGKKGLIEQCLYEGNVNFKKVNYISGIGRFLEPKEVKPEFDFYADDVVTVRGPEKSFWVCRILEDVLETSNQINVAWFDTVEENKYKVF